MPARPLLRRLGPALLLPVVGCAGSSADVDLLEARLRDQQDLVSRYERMADQSREELSASRQETNLLRTQLAQAGASPLLPEHADVLLRAEKLAFHPMMTGARNTDASTGDDVFNVVLTPQAKDGETIRLIGDLEIEALDLSRPEGQQQIGAWTYSADQARELWHSGFLSSGYQMDLAWDALPQSPEVVLHARLKTADGRQLDATQQIQVDLPVIQTAGLGDAPQFEPVRIEASRPVQPLLDAPPAVADSALPAVADVTVVEATPSEPQAMPSATEAPGEFPAAAGAIAELTESAPPAGEFPAAAISTPVDAEASAVPAPLDVPAIEVGAASDASLPTITPLNTQPGDGGDATNPPALMPAAANGVQIRPLPTPQRYRRSDPSVRPADNQEPATQPALPFDERQPAKTPAGPTDPMPFPVDVTLQAAPTPAALQAEPQPPVVQTSVNWTDDSIPYLR
jgi:hypothetical protein